MHAQFSTSILTLEPWLVVLWLHTKNDPPAAPWLETMGQIAKRRRESDVRFEDVRQLVISDGGAPNAVQRKQAQQCFDGLPYRLAVVTTALSSPLKRGVATAVTWVNPAVRFYGPEKFGEALEYLQLTAHRSKILEQYEKLQAELPPIRALELVRS